MRPGRRWQRHDRTTDARLIHRLRTHCVRQLATKPRLDEPEVGVVAPAIRPEYPLVALGDDCEATALRRVNRTLEIDAPPRVDHQPVARHAMAVDRDIGYASQRS